MNTDINKINKSVKAKIRTFMFRVKNKNKKVNNKFKLIKIEDLIKSNLVKELQEKHKTDARYGFVLKNKKIDSYYIDNLKIGYQETYKTREVDKLNKFCHRCNKRRHKKEFHKDRSNSDGLHSTCKECLLLKNSSTSGMARIIYKEQKRSSIKRKHLAPNYTKEWFTDWLLSNNEYKKLHSEWLNSGKKSELKPSVDRLNPLKSYTKDNIRVISWKENRDKGKYEDRIIQKEYKDKNVSKEELLVFLNKLSKIKYFFNSYASEYINKNISIPITRELFTFLIIHNEELNSLVNNITNPKNIKIIVKKINIAKSFSKDNIEILLINDESNDAISN